MDEVVYKSNIMKDDSIILVDVDGSAFVVEKKKIKSFLFYRINNSLKSQKNKRIKKKQEELNKTKNKRGYVYFIKEFHSNTYKIGKAKDIKQRLRFFGVKLPFKWELIHSIYTSDYSLAERLIHKEYSSKRLNGSEWFELSNEDIKKIKENQFPEELIELLEIKS